MLRSNRKTRGCLVPAVQSVPRWLPAIARRGAGSAALCCYLALAWPAAAQPEAVERTVVTQDGAMYRGEVKEYVVGDHITLKLDTGESHRIAWGDAVQISPPRSKQSKPPRAEEPDRTPKPANDPPPSSDKPAPVPSRSPAIVNNQPVPTPVAPNTERTVVSQNGVTCNGEVIEFEAGSHVLLKLATGERRRIPWGETKRISPPHSLGDTDPAASPQRTVVMPDGSTVRGDLVESVLGDAITLKMASGQIRRIAWKDAKRIMGPNPSGKPSTIPVTGELLVVLDNGRRVQGEYFEYVADDHLILRHATGGFRILPIGTIKKIVLLGDGAQ